MNYKPGITMNNQSIILDTSSWLFGLIAVAIGLINTFWGNDTGFGIFIILLSSIYFLPVNEILKNLAGISIPKMGFLKILLALFILWTSLGVGELFNKIDLMKGNL
jgi:hypothetical protein